MLIKKRNPKPEPLSIKNFHQRRNKVLFIRETGGLGDILMHRMMFEQAKKIMPESHIVFACPIQYHEAVEDHPYIDEVVDCKTVKRHEYLISFNTTSACTRHELSMAPLADKHRSDIWANHCGIFIEDHNMHINLDEEYHEKGRELLSRARNGHTGPSICLCPISAMITKNLLGHQMKSIIDRVREKGCFVYALHRTGIPELDKWNVPVIHGVSIRQWMGLIDISDYIVTVDSAAFHYAGAVKKPMVGIFTFADGKVYGKYFDFVLVQKHRDNGDWPCGPCYNWAICPYTNKAPKPCLTSIDDEMLKEGVDAMFDQWPVGVNCDQNTKLQDR